MLWANHGIRAAAHPFCSAQESTGLAAATCAAMSSGSWCRRAWGASCTGLLLPTSTGTPPPPRAGPQVQHPPWQQLPRRPPGISHAAWLTTDAGTQVCAVPRRGAAKHERPLPDGGAAGNKVSRLRPAPTSTARAAMRAPPPGHARLPARLCPAPAVRSTHSCSSGHLVGVRPLALPARARCRRPAGSATPCSWTGAWWADRCAG